MRIGALLFAMTLGAGIHAQQVFQLAPPLVQVSSHFFGDSTFMQVQFNQPGAAVHYTWEDRDPQASDPIYRAPLKIEKEGTLRIRSIGAGFAPSEVISLPFRQRGWPVDSVRSSPIHPYYAGLTANALIDGVGGNPQYRAGSWLGYDSDTVTVELFLSKKYPVKTILVDLLRDENSWIFLPNSMLVYYKTTSAGDWKMLSRTDHVSTEAASKQCVGQLISLPSHESPAAVKLVLINVNPIPDWHPGKGNKGWLFIDEILAY